MKRLATILAVWVVTAASAVQLTPFVYYGLTPNGLPLTNAITIQPWPATNTIVGVQTNLVGSIAYTFQPDANGYVSNNLAAGNYRLTIAGLSRGVTFGLPSTNTAVNLAQVSGVPVVTFMNFSIAQFSDAGTLSYSNVAAVVLRNYGGTGGVTNALGFAPATNTSAGLISALLYTPATNSSAGIIAALLWTPATNSNAGIQAALGYMPATNNYAAALDYGRITNLSRVWLTTNLADGSLPNAVLPNGSILTTSNGAFFVRSNAAWVQK